MCLAKELVPAAAAVSAGLRQHSGRVPFTQAFCLPTFQALALNESLSYLKELFWANLNALRQRKPSFCRLIIFRKSILFTIQKKILHYSKAKFSIEITFLKINFMLKLTIPEHRQTYRVP